MGFERERRAHKGRAVRQIAYRRLVDIDRYLSEFLFLLGQAVVGELFGVPVKIYLRLGAVVEHGFYQRSGFVPFLVFTRMRKQIVGVSLTE